MSSSKEKALASIESQIQSLLKQKARLEYDLTTNGQIIFSQLKSGTWIIEKSSGTYYQWMKNHSPLSVIARNGEWINCNNWTVINKFRLANPDEIAQHFKFIKAKGKSFESFSFPTPIQQKINSTEFFMVTLKQDIGSNKYHETYEIAESEALRLAKQEKKKAYIMGVVATIDVAVEEVLTTKIEKWTN